MKNVEAALIESGTVVQVSRKLAGVAQRGIVREVIGMTSPRVVVRLASGVEKIALPGELSLLI